MWPCLPLPSSWCKRWNRMYVYSQTDINTKCVFYSTNLNLCLDFWPLTKYTTNMLEGVEANLCVIFLFYFDGFPTYLLRNCLSWFYGPVVHAPYNMFDCILYECVLHDDRKAFQRRRSECEFWYQRRIERKPAINHTFAINHKISLYIFTTERHWKTSFITRYYI